MLICVLIDREMPVPLEVEVSESPRAAAVSDVASMQRRQDATTGIATTAGIAATFTRAATFTTGVVDMAQGVADLGVDSAKAAKGSAKAAAIAARAKARELRMRRARKLEPVPWYIVHPGCFGKVLWDTFAVLILVYTVVLAPLKLGFDVEDYCPSGLWWWEAIIDTTFFCDMLLNFVTAVYVDDDKGGMPLSTSLPTIACTYLRSWFAVDFVSSMPVDLFMSIIVHGCSGAPYGGIAGAPYVADVNGTAADSSALEALGLLRMVRILRLVKLLKILRVLRLQQRLEELRCEPTTPRAHLKPHRREGGVGWDGMGTRTQDRHAHAGWGRARRMGTSTQDRHAHAGWATRTRPPHADMRATQRPHALLASFARSPSHVHMHAPRRAPVCATSPLAATARRGWPTWRPSSWSGRCAARCTLRTSARAASTGWATAYTTAHLRARRSVRGRGSSRRRST